MTIYCTTNTRFKAAESPPPSGCSALDYRASDATPAKPDIEREFSGGGRVGFWNSARRGLATGQQRHAQSPKLRKASIFIAEHPFRSITRRSVPFGWRCLVDAFLGRKRLAAALRPLPGWSVSTDKWYPSLLIQRFSTQPLAGEPPLGPQSSPLSLR